LVRKPVKLDLGVDGRITFKILSQEHGVTMWTGFIWFTKTFVTMAMNSKRTEEVNN